MRPIVLAITGASGAPYALRLLEVLLSQDLEIHAVMSPAAAEVFRTEVGLHLDPHGLTIEQLVHARRAEDRKGLLARCQAAAFASVSKLFRGNRERIVSDAGDGDLPVLDGNAGGSCGRLVHESDSAGCGRAFEGTSSTDRGPARGLVERDPFAEHADLAASGRHRAACGTGLLSPAAIDRGFGRFCGDADLRSPGGPGETDLAMGGSGKVPVAVREALPGSEGLTPRRFPARFRR